MGKGKVDIILDAVHQVHSKYVAWSRPLFGYKQIIFKNLRNENLIPTVGKQRKKLPNCFQYCEKNKYVSPIVVCTSTHFSNVLLSFRIYAVNLFVK